jgi:hypothetical protein
MKAEELEHAAFIPRFYRPQMLTLLGIVFARMRSYALLLISLLIILVFGVFDVCCSVFHACTFYGRNGNGSCCCCCCMCLLLNVYASWSWRKERFVGEEQCYQGLTAEHVMIVVDFMV